MSAAFGNNPLINPLYEYVLWAHDNIQSVKIERIRDIILHAPWYYSEWWIKLYKEAPLHVYIETVLICFIIWLMFIRRTVDPKKASNKEKLSQKEVNWLIETWQPEPLVPPLTNTQQVVADSMLLIDAVDGNYMHIRGVKTPVLNLCTFDFLGMSQNSGVKQASKAALEVYGCGSCGPRGFYGTVDQHLKVEAAVAEFMGTQEAIQYSDGASAVSSTIPAFAKKGDLLLVDEACNEPIKMGLNLSRSTIQYFKHNDMADLEAILQSIADDDIRYKRDATQQRRFIVVEGIYRNTGDVCFLPNILALKERFRYRVILDESLSFGTMGATGRGITEHFGLKVTDVEIVTVAMDTALGSVGGLCLGTREVVDHQRLSGAGYCFSASAPPFLSAAACESLSQLKNHPEMLSHLHQNCQALHKGLSAVKGMRLLSAEITPVMHLVLDPPLPCRELEAATIMHIANNCIHRGVGVMASKFPLTESTDIGSVLRPSIRICASALLRPKEITHAIAELKKEVALAMTRLRKSTRTGMSTRLSM